jgi:GNAT superfamily N-acetyltransferase
MSNMRLATLTFEQIKEVWETKLWPGRTSPIEPKSAIAFSEPHSPSNIDMSIMEIDEEPYFVGMYDGDVLVGVNSGFRTSKTHYRSRGLYVEPAYRGRGIAQTLLREIMIEALVEDCLMVWSMPRGSARQAYLKAGFIQCSQWFNKEVEFGPNCFVVADVRDNAFVSSGY